MRISLAAVAALVALGSAACSSSTNGAPTVGPTSPGGVSAPSSATQPSPTGFPSSTSSAAGGLTEAQAKAALLTASDIGGGFSQTPADTSDTPLPCTPNQPPLSQQFPPGVKVEAGFGGLGGKALVSEEIESYADAGTVGQVIAAGEQGLACGTATVSGTKITIGGPTDLSAHLTTPVDKAEGWALSSSAVNGSLIVAQLGQHLVVFSFSADPSVSSSELPDAQQIVNDGLANVAAALK